MQVFPTSPIKRIFRSLRWRVQRGHLVAMSIMAPSVLYIGHQWVRERDLESADKEIALTLNILSASEFERTPHLSESRAWYAVLDEKGSFLLRSETTPEFVSSFSPPASEGYLFFQKERFLYRVLEEEKYTVCVGLPEKEVFEDSRKFLIFTGTLFLILSILALSVAWWLAGKSLSPIQRFAKTARRMSESTQFETLDLTDTHDELQDLGEVLNQTFHRLHRALEQQKKLTADASHELRTPLTALIAQVKRGQSDQRSVEDYRSIFEICDRSLARLKRIVDDLLELSRYDSGQVELDREELALDLLVTTIAEDYRPMIEAKGSRIECDVSPCSAYCDPFRIEQVLSNLMMNAINHNDEPVRLLLRVKEVDQVATIEVEDDGVGIPPESHAHLFDRFFQERKTALQGESTEEDKSSGLGLAISKAIIEAHGGRIQVRSEPQVTTVFEVRLPMNSDNESRAI